MTQNTVNLDSHQLAARMRSYSPRPVAPVQPRGVIDFANRGGFTDVMVTKSPSKPIQAKPVKPVPIEAPQKPTEQNSPSLATYIENPTVPKHTTKLRKQKNKRRFNVINSVLVGMAVVVFSAGMFVALKGYRTTQQISGATASAQSSDGGGTGEEVKPTEKETSNYTVASDMPRYIDIPRLNVHARVLQTDVKADGSLGAPSNIFDTSWFSQSAKPGSLGGASLIDGHVSGPTQKGVFYGLSSLSVGDLLMVERGDGQKIYYKVSKTEVVSADKVDMAKMLLSVTPGKAGLNLISCTGKFDSKTQTFEDRALVYAEQVQI